MTPESISFNILNILATLKKFEPENVPNDQNDPDNIHYHILRSNNLTPSLTVQKPKTPLNKAFLDDQNRANNFSLDALDIAEADRKILQNMKSRGYVISIHSGTPFATGETRPFAFGAETTSSQPNEEEIFEVYREILDQVHGFIKGDLQVELATEGGFKANVEYVTENLINLANTFGDIETGQENKNQISEAVDEINNLRPDAKIAAFMGLSVRQIRRIIQYSTALVAIQDKLDSGSKYPGKRELLWTWFTKVCLVNLRNINKFRPEINFFQARDILLGDEAAGKARIAHLEPFKCLPPNTSLARILADAFKLCSKQEIDANGINSSNRIERFDKLLVVVYSLIPENQHANFKSVLVGVLIDMLRDVVLDAKTEFDKLKAIEEESDSTQNDGELAQQETILGQTTKEMIQAILKALQKL